ncbi:MAG TPA: SEC-C metal-binding domain-containing protein, partial [Acidothermaceae bacterium]
FEIRKNVLKYDEVLNKQRTVIYTERRRVLHGDDLHEQVRNMVDDVVRSYIEAETVEGYAEDWDLDKLWKALKALYPVGMSIEALEAAGGGGREGLSADFIIEEMTADAQSAYDNREQELGTLPDGEMVMRQLERQVVLTVLDRKWREHLYEMDYLQEGIQLRSYGQRDPLVEYQREGFTMFTTMMDAIKEESVGLLFNLEVQVATPEAAPEAIADDDGSGSAPAAPRTIAQEAAASDGGRHAAPQLVAPGLEAPKRAARLEYSAPSIDGDSSASGGGQPAVTQAASDAPLMYEGTPRNAKCPCGSGRAYKRCHGDPRSAQ